MEPTPAGICLAPFYQNFIKEDGKCLLQHTQGSFWSLVPTLSDPTSLFLEESAVRPWKGWTESAGDLE